jgi:hypothetical protein
MLIFKNTSQGPPNSAPEHLWHLTVEWAEFRSLSLIFSTPPQVQLALAKPSASAAPLGPLTPSEVNARSFCPALTPLSQIKAYFFPPQEESAGDLLKKETGPLTT